MKERLRWCLGFIALTLVSVGAEPNMQARLRTEMLVVQVPQALGIELRPQLRDEQTVSKAVTQLYSLIAEGRATLVGAPIAWSRSGERVVAETIEEVRYACEFIPPQVPSWFGYKPGGTFEERLSNILYQIDVPTAFETRNTGVSLELEANLASDGRSIVMAMVPQHVIYEGERPTLTLPPADRLGPYAQPKFRSFKTTANLTLTSGVWTLVSVNILPEKTWELCLLRTTVLSK
jgi:hypothetical protein